MVQPLRHLPQAPPKPPDFAEDHDLSGAWESFDAPLALPFDNLSKITEGSNEASEISSMFFSAVSALTSKRTSKSKPSRCTGALGQGMPALLVHACMSPAIDGMGCTLPTPTRAGARPSNSKLQAIPESPDLRQLVKEFVESAVRGCCAEALCGNGRTQPVVFRLNRKVDAFELAPVGSGAPYTVALTDLAAVHLGGDAWTRSEEERLVAGVDASCAVLELVDGRCSALRFHGWGEGGGEAQAKSFVLCMQTFANELHCHRPRT